MLPNNPDAANRGLVKRRNSRTSCGRIALTGEGESMDIECGVVVISYRWCEASHVVHLPRCRVMTSHALANYKLAVAPRMMQISMKLFPD